MAEKGVDWISRVA